MKAQPSKQRTRNPLPTSQEKRATKELSIGPAVQKPLPTGDDLQARITTRAYELYVERGCRQDCAEQDWLDAEREILNHRFAV